MVNFKEWSIVLIAAGLFAFCLIPALAGDPASTESQPGDMKIYYCDDPLLPCISDKADGCSNCQTVLKNKDLKLSSLMELLQIWSGETKKGMTEMQFPSLKLRAQGIVFLSEKVGTMKPQKNVEQIDGFIQFAGQLKNRGEELEKAAGASDAEMFKTTFQQYSMTCSACHKQYR